MSATTVAEKRPTETPDDPRLRSHPVKGSSSVLYKTLCVLDAGYAKHGVTATGLLCCGTADASVDNTSGSDGDLSCNFREGVTCWVNGDSIAQSDVGKPAFITDNRTVAKAGSGKSFAGMIQKVNSAGVWVYSALWLSKTYATAAAAQVAADAAQASADSANGSWQFYDQAIASGTGTKNTVITLASNSEVFVDLKTAVTGSTNFASVGELRSSRVNGAASTATIVVKAFGADGAVDSDAACTVRVGIYTPGA